MNLVEVYNVLCDETRLRILHLLANRPLCVCHFQDILSAPQVKISKHLAYLREHGMVETHLGGLSGSFTLSRRILLRVDCKYEVLAGLLSGECGFSDGAAQDAEIRGWLCKSIGGML